MGKKIPQLDYDIIQQYLAGESPEFVARYVEETMQENPEIARDVELMKELLLVCDVSKQVLEQGDHHKRHLGFIEQWNEDHPVKRVDQRVSDYVSEAIKMEKTVRSWVGSTIDKYRDKLAEFDKQINILQREVEEDMSDYSRASTLSLIRLREIRARLAQYIDSLKADNPFAAGSQNAMSEDSYSVQASISKDMEFLDIPNFLRRQIDEENGSPSFRLPEKDDKALRYIKFMARWKEFAESLDGFDVPPPKGVKADWGPVTSLFDAAAKNGYTREIQRYSDAGYALATIWLAEEESDPKKARDLYALAFKQSREKKGK